MQTECAESGCPNQTDSGIYTECAAEQKYGTTSWAYNPDGHRVELREDETRDNDSHADVVAAQLAVLEERDSE